MSLDYTTEYDLVLQESEFPPLAPLPSPPGSKPLDALLIKPVYLLVLLIGGLVFIAWGVIALLATTGHAFALGADGRGVSVATAGGVWFDAGALRLRALELRDAGAPLGAASIASLGLLRGGCRVAATAEAGGGAAYSC